MKKGLYISLAWVLALANVLSIGYCLVACADFLNKHILNLCLFIATVGIFVVSYMVYYSYWILTNYKLKKKILSVMGAYLGVSVFVFLNDTMDSIVKAIKPEFQALVTVSVLLIMATLGFTFIIISDFLYEIRRLNKKKKGVNISRPPKRG